LAKRLILAARSKFGRMIVEGRVVGKGHNDRQEEKPPSKGSGASTYGPSIDTILGLSVAPCLPSPNTKAYIRRNKAKKVQLDPMDKKA